MKITRVLTVLFFIVFIFAGCTSSQSSDNQIELTSYNFTMYGQGGAKIADGVMTVKNMIALNANEPSISGTYKVTHWYTENFSAKSTFNGEFSGNMDYEKGKMFMNMNPRLADANVFFNMSIYSSFYQGEWNYSTFRGPTSRGEVKITKQK